MAVSSSRLIESSGNMPKTTGKRQAIEGLAVSALKNQSNILWRIR